MDDRTALIERIRAEKNTCSEEVKRLQERATVFSAKARLSYEEQVADLQRRCSVIDRELHDLEQNRSSLKDARERLLDGMEELKARIEELRARSTGNRRD